MTQVADGMQGGVMLNDKLTVGKKVEVRYTDETTLVGILRHTPSDTRDHFMVERDGELFSFNPTSSTLECLVQELDANSK